MVMDITLKPITKVFLQVARDHFLLSQVIFIIRAK